METRLAAYPEPLQTLGVRRSPRRPGPRDTI